MIVTEVWKLRPGTRFRFLKESFGDQVQIFHEMIPDPDNAKRVQIHTSTVKYPDSDGWTYAYPKDKVEVVQ